MANDERRKSDEKMEEILILIKEVHQRQNEVTIPAIADMKQTLYSRGGVCETIHVHNGEIKELTERVGNIPTIIMWVLGGVSVGAGALLWVYEVAQKLSSGGSK